jgi:hypothetical protein
MRNRYLIALAVVVLATFYIGQGMGANDQKKKTKTILSYWYNRTYDTFFYNFNTGEVEAGRCFTPEEDRTIMFLTK